MKHFSLFIIIFLFTACNQEDVIEMVSTMDSKEVVNNDFVSKVKASDVANVFFLTY